MGGAGPKGQIGPDRELPENRLRLSVVTSPELLPAHGCCNSCVVAILALLVLPGLCCGNRADSFIVCFPYLN